MQSRKSLSRPRHLGGRAAAGIQIPRVGLGFMDWDDGA